MDKSDIIIAKGRFGYLFAAAVGSAMVYFTNNAGDSSSAKILVYFIPAITLVVGALAGEIEEIIVSWWKIFRSDLDLKQYLSHTEKALQAGHLDDSHRELIVARRNQLQAAALDSVYKIFNSKFEAQEIKKKPIRKAVNKNGSVPTDSN